MFSKEEIKRSLLGCFEILLFMPRGVERFGNDKGQMIRSFIVPFSMMPFVIAIVVNMFPEFPALLIASLVVFRGLLATILFFGIVYFMAKQMDRQEHFLRFLTIANWTNINGIVIAVPILIGLALGVDTSTFEVYAVFSEILGYVYGAFVMTYCLRIPWEMGGFISVVALAINQNLWALSDYIRDTAML
jgi:uncharacterized membrane protein